LVIHSYNSSFEHSLSKILALRLSNITADELKFLGMQDGSFDDVSKVGRWPLVKLGCAIESVKHLIPKKLMESRLFLVLLTHKTRML